MLIGYARVSTLDQTLALQQDALRAAGCERIFTDTASGARTDRPGLADSLGHLRQGDTLVIWRLDRLTRSGIRDTLNTVETFRKHGVQLVSITDNINMDGGPIGDLLISVLAASAQIERLTITERIAAARERMEAQGRAWGRPRRLGEAEVARIRQLRKAGRKIREIAVALKVPRSTISDALNPPRRKALSGKDGADSAARPPRKRRPSAPRAV